MSVKIIIDTSSLINYSKYFIFDKNDSSIIYMKLLDFILTKVKENEIIIIDKVFQELRNPNIQELKKLITKQIFSTEHLLDKIEPILEENIVQINLEQFDEWGIESLKQEYRENHADLYLIAYCEEIISQSDKPILITEETINKDKKLVEKIPTICKRKNIECKNLPFLLFDFYKDQLRFDLEIINN